MCSALADLVRGKPALIAENALLREQLIILRRKLFQPGHGCSFAKIGATTQASRCYTNQVMFHKVPLWGQMRLLSQIRDA